MSKLNPNLIKHRVGKNWKVVADFGYDDEKKQARKTGDARAVTMTRTGVMAGGYRSSTAVKMELHHNYSGSGPDAFGGAPKWPSLDLHVSLPAGKYELQFELAAQLAAVCDRFAAEKGIA